MIRIQFSICILGFLFAFLWTGFSAPFSSLSRLLPLPWLVGLGGLEPPTSRLSGVRSNHLSYAPKFKNLVWTSPFKAGDENRTRDNSLEGCSFTTKLHPLKKWELTGSNRWPSACKADALPAELNSLGMEFSSANGEKLRFSYPPIEMSIPSPFQLS